MFTLSRNLAWVVANRLAPDPQEITIVFVGLDNAGKTTLVNTVGGKRAKAELGGGDCKVVPTVGGMKPSQ